MYGKLIIKEGSMVNPEWDNYKPAKEKKMPKKKDETTAEHKSVFGVGVTIQIAEYEPIKVYASEETLHDGSDPEGVDLDLAKRVMSRLDTMTSEVALKIAEIKERVIQDLSDVDE
jgi:hypothetical protein